MMASPVSLHFKGRKFNFDITILNFILEGLSPQLAMAGGDGVLARWNVLDGETAIRSADRIIRTIYDRHPGEHPGMHVALKLHE